MCGRTVTGDVSWEQYHDWLNITRDTDAKDLQPRYNNAPTTINPVFIPDGAGLRGISARWGLVPHWFSGPVSQMKYATFNARSEDAASKPSFRDAMRAQHCLVPVQGYYEWKGPKGDKTPYLVSVKTNAPGFCLAGLYSKIDLPDFQGYTYTVLTEPSRDPIANLHSRMPVMLDESSYDDWLGADIALSAINRVDPARIDCHRVGKAVGNVRNDGPSLIEPFD